jgi:trans-AT polyketide synthase/acyltransferase/oxidoreductase domain-containing protein
MGGDLFAEYPEQTAVADAVLGTSIRNLCVEDPGGLLTRTDFTQPALFVVSALMHLKRTASGTSPDFVAGHSVGEFAALFAAGVFDFETGLRLTRKRGELMSQARGGGMAAVIGMSEEQVRATLSDAGRGTIDIANLNSPQQTVISGLADDVLAVREAFESAGAKMFVPLPVSGAFHSRYMRPSQAEFESFLSGFTLAPPRIPVISNVTAQPHRAGEIGQNLVAQITSPVRWSDTIRYLLALPDPQFEEIGPGMVLTGLTRQIKAATA